MAARPGLPCLILGCGTIIPGCGFEKMKNIPTFDCLFAECLCLHPIALEDMDRPHSLLRSSAGKLFLLMLTIMTLSCSDGVTLTELRVNGADSLSWGRMILPLNFRG